MASIQREVIILVVLIMLCLLIVLGRERLGFNQIEYAQFYPLNHFFEKLPGITADNISLPYFTHMEIVNAIQTRKTWSSMLYRKYKHELIQGEPEGHQRFEYLGPVAPQCMHLESFGIGDNEKRACQLNELLRNSPTSNNCTVVSLGSNNQWGFEQAIYQNLSDCKIHTFDCTVPVLSLIHI